MVRLPSTRERYVWTVLDALGEKWAPIGLAAVLGAFALKKAAEVAFGEALKRSYHRLVKRWRRWTLEKKARQFRADSFRVGNIEARIFVLEYWPDGLSSEHLRCRLVSGDEWIANEVGQKELAEAYRLFDIEEQEGKVFNGSKLALKALRLSRSGGDRSPKVHLDFCRSEYRLQRAVETIYAGLPAMEREAICSDPFKVNSTFSNTFGVSLAIVTSDAKLLVSRRSSSVGPEKAKIIFGLAEGMTGNDLRDLSIPDPWMTGSRSLSREFGLVARTSRMLPIRFFALCLNQHLYQYNFYGICDLREDGFEFATADHVVKNYGTGRPVDKFETAKIDFLKFNVDDVLSFIKDNRPSITDYAVVTAIYALASEPTNYWDRIDRLAN